MDHDGTGTASSTGRSCSKAMVHLFPERGWMRRPELLKPSEITEVSVATVGMFTLTEVASLNDIKPTYRILKPWWDVFMDYLGIVMLMLAIFSGTMQITKDQVVCLPVLEANPEETSGVIRAEPTESNDRLWNRENAMGEQAAPSSLEDFPEP
ncbi:hypothetical protein WMY93_023827 [Mugilogobius chulae]|uniref:LRRC8 pannexin-like TM region domain-containing protein n=1 Tax=Mugilogobius chulae TaxID=88201 RepID=A0AAW0NHP5_9GOBI